MSLQPSRVGSILRQILLVWLILMAMSARSAEAKCAFKAIFNFGDSNSDTGGFWAAFPAQSPPFGMTYFKRPVGRATDGRLIIDFLGISPFSLAIQLNQMKQFKVEVEKHHRTHAKGAKLPAPSIFGKSLYTFYIGQNDFTSNLVSLGISGVKQFLPQVVSQIAYTIKDLYSLGGRTFLVLNLAPVGCYPALLVELPHNSTDVDEFGCLISYNNAVVDYNNMLKEALTNIRKDLPKASVVYVDTHAVLLELFQHPKSHGLKYGTKACCGYGGGAQNFNQQVYCGNNKLINGHNVTATACSDPQNYVSWDGIHATEAANKLTAHAILNGSYSDPPFPLHKFCDIQPIG
nr:GDSL esterase/lipase At4g01130-like isoform X2 [Coffea arabica]